MHRINKKRLILIRKFNFFFDRQKRKPIKVLKLYHMMSTNAIFVVAQRGFSAQVEIKIGIRRDEKIRNARTNSSSVNPLINSGRQGHG